MLFHEQTGLNTASRVVCLRWKGVPPSHLPLWKHGISKIAVLHCLGQRLQETVMFIFRSYCLLAISAGQVGRLTLPTFCLFGQLTNACYHFHCFTASYVDRCCPTLPG